MVRRGEGSWADAGRALMVARWWGCERVPPNEFFQPNRVIMSVGTQASGVFCRDKGRGWADVGALCLSSSG
jgi:hypothetical protein